MSTRNSRGTAQRLWVKAVALILVGLMLFGTVYMAIAFIIDASAAETLAQYAFSTVSSDEDFRLAVGLRYGSSAYELHGMTSPFGFVVGEAEVTRTVHGFEPLYVIYETDIAAVVDANLTVGYQSCTIAKNEADTDIGGYHVELALIDGNVWDLLDDLYDLYAVEYEQVFPSYIDGKKTLRIGSFPNYTKASAAAAAIGASLEGFEISVASPTSSGVCFINADYDTILFEYSGTDYKYGGVCALQEENEEHSYILYEQTSNLYDGVFCFPRYISSSYNGLTLINLVELDPYVEGVIPNEISNTWHVECQKAFAIMARSVAFGNLNKHFTSYGFDVCAASNCQVYNGRKLVTNAVTDAVSNTKNLILTYEGGIAGAAYSSSQGGYSAASQYVWYGELSYLISQPTPWEDYYGVSRGTWTTEITQTALATAFKNAGYSNIKGSKITSVSYETMDNSTYIYSFTGTDNNGNTATVTRSSNITSMLGSKFYSANFVIGKGSVTYTHTDVLSNTIIDLSGSFRGEMSVYTGNGVAVSGANDFNFFTDLGQAIKDMSNALYVLTENGTSILISEENLPVSTTPDVNGIYTVVSDFGDFLIVSKLQDITKTYTASSSSNWAVAGRGWGHGVGASQYGTQQLATAGAKYDQIIRAYFPNTKIENFTTYSTD